MNELVSAIITTYKRPPEIVERAAKSVLNQTYKNIELVIVDDSPETYEQRDEVCDMALALGKRVKYIQHEKNMGACAARNTGINNASGEFIAFLDDDDEWLPEKIEKQLEVMKKDDAIALVYCGRFTFYAEENRTVEQNVKFYRGYVYKNLILDNFIGSTSFPLMRKKYLSALGGFDEKMPAAQDYELWLRIARRYRVDYVEEPLVRYYVHDGEQITKNRTKKREGLERLNELNMDYLKSHRKAHSIRILRALKFYIDFDLKRAKKLFLKAIMLYPVPNIDMLKTFKHLFVAPIINKKL